MKGRKGAAAPPGHAVRSKSPERTSDLVLFSTPFAFAFGSPEFLYSRQEGVPVHWHQAHARKQKQKTKTKTEYEFLSGTSLTTCDSGIAGACASGSETLMHVLVLVTVARRIHAVSKRPRCDQPSPLSPLASLTSRYVPYQERCHSR